MPIWQSLRRLFKRNDGVLKTLATRISSFCVLLFGYSQLASSQGSDVRTLNSTGTVREVAPEYVLEARILERILDAFVRFFRRAFDEWFWLDEIYAFATHFLEVLFDQMKDDWWMYGLLFFLFFLLAKISQENDKSILSWWKRRIRMRRERAESIELEGSGYCDVHGIPRIRRSSR